MLEHIHEILVRSDDAALRRITLALGDLARIDRDEAVDLLVVSALLGDYTPTPTSLIGQLAREGISVAQLAADKALDLRETTGAWLSRPLEGAGFRRLVCFEPATLGDPPQVVGQLFRALFPFLHEETDQVVAMPLIAGGDAGWSPQEMTLPLLDAAIGWLKIGLPVSRLLIVERSESKIAQMRDAFETRRDRVVAVQNAGFKNVARRRSREIPPDMPLAKSHRPKRKSVFLSFSSREAAAADLVVRCFAEVAPAVEVFDFRRDIPIGVSYQREIDAALARSDKLLCLLSPDYLASAECEEELMVARLRNKRMGFAFLWPVYWRGVQGDLQDWIMILNLADCREADRERLAATIERVVRTL